MKRPIFFKLLSITFDEFADKREWVIKIPIKIAVFMCSHYRRIFRNDGIPPCFGMGFFITAVRVELIPNLAALVRSGQTRDT